MKNRQISVLNIKTLHTSKDSKEHYDSSEKAKN